MKVAFAGLPRKSVKQPSVQKKKRKLIWQWIKKIVKMQIARNARFRMKNEALNLPS